MNRHSAGSSVGGQFRSTPRDEPSFILAPAEGEHWGDKYAKHASMSDVASQLYWEISAAQKAGVLPQEMKHRVLATKTGVVILVRNLGQGQEEVSNFLEKVAHEYVSWTDDGDVSHTTQIAMTEEKRYPSPENGGYQLPEGQEHGWR